MADDFGIVFELLEKHTSEVGGRAVPDISRELRQELANLAAGNCNEEQRQGLIRVLVERPDLLPVLAQEIRKLRKLPQ